MPSGNPRPCSRLSLGVFDRLHEALARAAPLAQALGVDSGALAGLLDGCAALGLLGKRQGLYSNQAVVEAYLWSGSPDSLCGYVRYSDEALYPMWGSLADAVREGSPRWKQTFAVEGGIRRIKAPIALGLSQNTTGVRDAELPRIYPIYPRSMAPSR
ncbi:MAG: methyltransferase dimerization domain-containing protein [Bryobacteraceae bacterium]|jgi:hypothetical protein